MTERQMKILVAVIVNTLTFLLIIFVMANIHHFSFLTEAVGWLVDVLRIGEAP